MRTCKKALAVILVIIVGALQSYGQINIPDFSERVDSYLEKNKGELVYLQTDREVYYGGDKLNFKAFIRDLHTLKANSHSKNMHLILVDPFGNLQQEKIFEVESNQSSGALDILDGLPSGEYKLIAWTNEMETGPVERVFTKKIFIHNKMMPALFIKLSAGETNYLPGDIGQVKVELINSLGNPVKRKKFSYTLSHNGSILTREDGKTDKYGNASIDIEVPDIHELGVLVFEITVNHMGENTISNIVVPTTKSPVWIEFAPEGGLFVDGIETLVGFKTYNYMGHSVDIEGEVLDSNGTVITKIKSFGMGFGSFTAKAEAANPLKVRITKPSGIDMEYPLPDVQKNGIRLSLQEKSTGSLKFLVDTDIKDEAVSLHAVATSGGKLIFEKRFNLKSSTDFTIPVEAKYQHQLVDVNLLNRNGDVLAHRSVFVSGENPVELKASNTVDDSGKFPMEIEITGNNNLIAVPADIAVGAYDQFLAPGWNPLTDIMSWFMFGNSSSLASFSPGFLVNPGETELKTIDSYLLFHFDDKYDWPNIKTGRKQDQPASIQEFRDNLKQFYQTGDFEKLISLIRANEFFRVHFAEKDSVLTDFIRRNKPELEKSGYLPVRMSTDEKTQMQLQQGKSIMSVLMTIKPYKLMDNKIVFRGNDSYNYQGGAIIVIDGVMRGTDPGILSGISPYDVESIKASANIADIQKYSGLNSTGVVEITTKKASGSETARQIPQTSHPTLFWDGQFVPNNNGGLQFQIKKPAINSQALILVQGIDASGNFLIWTNN